MKFLLLLSAAAGATALALSNGETTAPTASPIPADAGAAAGLSQDAAAAGAAATGSITGRVVWDGDLPEPLPPVGIEAKASEGCCPAGVTMDTKDRSLLVDAKGGIANVVLTVAVKDMPVVVPEGANYHVDQKLCQFEPHVLVMPVGGTLTLLNSDSVNHNLHTYSQKNDAFNSNVAGGGKLEHKMAKAESFKVGCDIHPWMAAYVFVSDDPIYTVSGADGSYRLDGLPAGTYKVSMWHERGMKGKSEEITVTAGGEAKADLKLGESKGKKRR